jgi:hypothetical protein
MGALGITVSQTHLGTSVAVLAFATICIHLHKVQSTPFKPQSRVESSTV